MKTQLKELLLVDTIPVHIKWDLYTDYGLNHGLAVEVNGLLKVAQEVDIEVKYNLNIQDFV